ncbi:MAG: SDR family oxidoreductase [Clostridiales Family XIII bacterium]|jgi:gluconate 5-dehydrogenase|nr:SDR family oxidoreductase [Clostridiales Family XIII bacterium]
MGLFDLTGRNAVVVGGAGGIGQAVAQGLAEAGARVAIASRSEDSLKRAVAEIKEATGLTLSYYTADATDEDSVAALAATAHKDFGKVDILVNSQGFNKKFDAQEFPMDVFKQMLEVNVYSVMLCCKHFGAYMIRNKYGKIINVSSVRGKIATKTTGNCGYCATKGAVDMLTRQLASEFGQYGITVNAFGPTVTETPMMTAMIESRGGDTYRKQLADGLPMKKMAVPEDCIGTAVYLASSASDFVTGNIVYPDGGLTAVG